MTNTHAQAADAILALINGKPWTPTRDEIVSALAKLPPAATPLPPLPMRPTDLGWELIEKLMPAYVEAVRYSGSCSDDDPDFPELDAATSEAFDVIWDRKFDATDLVDLAIAYRISIDGETPQETLAAAKSWWERSDRHEGYDEPADYDGTPDSARNYMDSSAILAYKLVSAILFHGRRR